MRPVRRRMIGVPREPPHCCLRRLRLRRRRPAPDRPQTRHGQVHASRRQTREPAKPQSEAAARELQEEVGIVVDPDELELMGVLAGGRRQRGRHGDRGHRLHGTRDVECPAVGRDRRDPLAGPGRRSCPADLAPLLTDHILPELAALPARLGSPGVASKRRSAQCNGDRLELRNGFLGHGGGLGELRPVQLRVPAVGGEQLGVGAALHDRAVLHHQDRRRRRGWWTAGGQSRRRCAPRARRPGPPARRLRWWSPAPQWPRPG